jgi:glycosyltransferase involved in cell wall biosynthesis
VTRQNNQQEIETALKNIHGPKPEFEYLELPGAFLWLKRHLGYPGLLMYYYLWQVALAKRARQLHRRLRFEITHHVTFVNDSLPSGLCFVPVPFVWGPVGGSTHHLPRTMDLHLPPYARTYELMRAILQFLLRKCDPFVALTRRRAQVVLTYTREAQAGLPKAVRPRSRAVLHLGITKSEPPQRPSRPIAEPNGELLVLTGGRLVHWKGYDLLIEGFAAFMQMKPRHCARLIITGSGQYEHHLKMLAEREGVGELVEFVGHLPSREEVFDLMGRCHLFALPTLRDGPPFALLEAMAVGLPVLCLDLGATGEAFPAEVSIKVPAKSREDVVEAIANALAWTATHPEQAVALGSAGRQYALDHYEWSRLADEIRRTYSNAI